MVNPFLGVFFHWLGGLASASFYIPYRGVKKWSWETYWLVGGVFSWIIAPLFVAWLLVPDVWNVIGTAYANNPTEVVWAYIFGTMWGLGGLTFGLTMRYLGIALGMAVALGYCAAFGTLMPPIFDGTIRTIIHETSGQIILAGVAICLAGIGVTGMAGMSKERELSEEEKQATVKEFNFFKGILVATFSGIMSAAFAYGLAVGAPIGDLAKATLLEQGHNDIWQNLPVLVVVLWGGFTTNFIWCLILNIMNRSSHEYFALHKEIISERNRNDDESDTAQVHSERVPILGNYLFSALAGVTWYLQFFFYSMGQTRMGKYEFSSWTLHMASIIIFSSLWGIALREWKGTSRRTHVLLAIGLVILIGSTIIVGYGNFLKEPPGVSQ
ncbi:MAG: L-rhamnose/proton symporter RhaT [Pirellulaceae bacterium]